MLDLISSAGYVLIEIAIIASSFLPPLGLHTGERRFLLFHPFPAHDVVRFVFCPNGAVFPVRDLNT